VLFRSRASKCSNWKRLYYYVEIIATSNNKTEQLECRSPPNGSGYRWYRIAMNNSYENRVGKNRRIRVRSEKDHFYECRYKQNKIKFQDRFYFAGKVICSAVEYVNASKIYSIINNI